MAQSPTKKQLAQLKKMKKILSQKISPRMTPAERSKFSLDKPNRRPHAPVIEGKGRYADGGTKAAVIAALLAAFSKTKVGKIAVPALKKLLAKAAAGKVKLAGTALGVSKKFPKVKQVFPGGVGEKLAAEGVRDARAHVRKISERLAREVDAGTITTEQAYQVVKREAGIPAQKALAVLKDVLDRRK